ncbi:MAG: AraC family transcriptional regulator [Chloroflexota bacterium]
MLNVNVNQQHKTTFAVHQRVGQTTTAWHDHERHQLVYAEDGALSIQTQTKHLLLPARHAAWLPARSMHRLSSRSPHLYLRTLYFWRETYDLLTLQQFHVFPLSTMAKEMIVYTEKWDVKHEAGVLEMSFLQTLRLLIGEWVQVTLPLALPATDNLRLDIVATYMQQHLAESLCLDSVAALYGMSGRTLLRLFKAEWGMTFGAYLRLARIIKALELLSQPDASVIEVSYAVGYSSPASFSQTFTKLVGHSPQMFLKPS